jgi:hypothetical protein
MSYNETQAISLGHQITDSLTSAMIDSFEMGRGQLATQQAIDATVVQAMIKCLEFYDLNGADTEFTQTKLNTIVSIVNEFDSALMLNVGEFAIQVGSEEDALGTGNSVVVLKSGAIIPQPRIYTWIVAVNGDSIFQVPFDIAQVDADTLTLTLNDADPIYNTSYTIVGTTLTWIGEYPLSAGWKFELKYWL